MHSRESTMPIEYVMKFAKLGLETDFAFVVLFLAWEAVVSAMQKRRVRKWY